MEDLREQPVLKVKPEDGESFLPFNFYDAVAHRYFPVLSLTYIASVLGMALKMSGSDLGFFHYFFQTPDAYRLSYWVALWTSVPAVIWILMDSAFHIRQAAGIWYKASAGLMVLILLVSFVLFPLAETGTGLRLFFVATVPIFFVQYYFFVKGGLPARAAWPLSVAGITLCVYGLIL